MSTVKGIELDAQSRCKHWHSDRDIIAIKLACCGEYYACIDCHAELADHPADNWSPATFSKEPTVRCGNCTHEMTFLQYRAADNRCPNCSAPFNPRCALHWPLYYQVDET